jgi:hypothetical protein
LLLRRPVVAWRDWMETEYDAREEKRWSQTRSVFRDLVAWDARTWVYYGAWMQARGRAGRWQERHTGLSIRPHQRLSLRCQRSHSPARLSERAADECPSAGRGAHKLQTAARMRRGAATKQSAEQTGSVGGGLRRRIFPARPGPSPPTGIIHNLVPPGQCQNSCLLHRRPHSLPGPVPASLPSSAPARLRASVPVCQCRLPASASRRLPAPHLSLSACSASDKANGGARV